MSIDSLYKLSKELKVNGEKRVNYKKYKLPHGPVAELSIYWVREKFRIITLFRQTNGSFTVVVEDWAKPMSKMYRRYENVTEASILRLAMIGYDIFTKYGTLENA